MGQRFEGRNLDEALEHASAALGVERYQLAYHVVLERRGFLGGIKRLVIEAEVSENPPAVPPVFVPAAAPMTGPPRRETRPQRPGGRGERAGRGDRGERGGRREGRRSDDRPRRDPADRAHAAVAEPAPPQGAESEEAAMLRRWCDQLAELADLDFDTRSEETEEQISIRFYGRDAELFVEREGELLDSIQTLANKAFAGRKIEKQIQMDAGGFKQQREQLLEKQAREAADRVRGGGGEELLPAMTPVERRIVHLTLQDDADVTTESRGDGFYKRVAIVPRGAAEQQEP